MTLILSGTNGLSDVDGTAATPAIRGTDTNTGIFFPAADTIAFSEGGTEAMRIDSSGNVGIGTASPAKRLSVVNATDATTVGTNSVMTVQAGSSINSVAEIGFSYGSWGGTNPIASLGYQITSNAGVGSGALTFSTRSVTTDTAPSERMRIDSSGNFMVGTTTAGNGGFTIQKDQTYGAWYADIDHPTGVPSAYPYGWFRYNGTIIGSISQSGTTAVSYITTSDYRLKDNIEPLTGALARIAALKPCTYTWKSAPDEIGEGFIAHELAEVCQQAVTGEKDAVNEDGSIKPQGIDTSFLVATLTAAIQEQQAIITQLQADVEALKGTA